MGSPAGFRDETRRDSSKVWKDFWEESHPLRLTFYVYILQSLKDYHFYYGSTSNLDERLVYHNKGKVRATKSRIPWRIHYYETFSTRKEAIQRELFFKSRAGYRWLKSQDFI